MPIGRKKISAFTLVEIMIVLAITMFLLTIALQSAWGSSAQLNFINSTNKVIDMIREARSLALAGKTQLDYTNFLGTDCPTCLITPAGYGVAFEHYSDPTIPDQAILFVDNHSLFGGEGTYVEDNLANYNAGTDIVLEKFVLPKGIFFNGNGILAFGQNDSKRSTIIYTAVFADVIFDPPTIVPSLSNLLTFGLTQSGSVPRSACFQIHKVSGLPTPTDNATCSST